MKTATIELRWDHSDASEEAKDKMLRTHLIQKARELKTLAMLTKGRYKPQIAIKMGDFFAVDEEIDLAKEGDTDGVGDEPSTSE